MSSALTNHPDLSGVSQPDLSLGSLANLSSGFGLGGDSRVPSVSTRSTIPSSAPLSTPSPPFRRNLLGKGEETPGSLSSRLNTLSQREKEDLSIDAEAFGPPDVLATPAPDRGLARKWDEPPPTEDTGAALPTKANLKRGAGKGAGPNGKGATLTLRDQEKHIDNLKKENFDLKLRVHFLEERLGQVAPDQVEAALKHNITLKIELHNRGQELKKLKKLVGVLQEELERSQANAQQNAPGRNRTQSERERELENKLEERERELDELRRRSSRAATSGYTPSEDDERDALLREADARNAELEDQLENARGLLEESTEEMERLREVAEQGRHGDGAGDVSTASARNMRRERENLHRQLEEAEEENRHLHEQLQGHIELLNQREDEKEELADEVDALRLRLEDMEHRREAEMAERSESRAQFISEREEREAVEEDLNAFRDKLAAVMIELQTKEDEIEVKNREIDELVTEHQRIVEVVEDEWRGEVEEHKTRAEEIKDFLAEREAECEALRAQNSELENARQELHAKFETALGHLEVEADQKEVEIESMQATIDKLGEQLYNLEDENDRLKEEFDKVKEEEGAERDRLEALTEALKEKVARSREQLQQTTDEYESCVREVQIHRKRQEELAKHVEELVKSLNSERSARERADADLDMADKEHDAAVRAHKRVLDAKESALQSALSDLGRAQALLKQREADVTDVQRALQTLEKERKKLGESHTTAQFSLQLEADRLKRDLERVEDELARARRELDDRLQQTRDKDGTLDKLHAENRDLAAQLAAQTQARLNVSEKLDGIQAALKAAESDNSSLKSKISEMEGRMSKDQRTLHNAESQYRDQLTERNTLLLTIYQYLDKILGVDRTPKKGGQAETKPFTNFSVFHDNLITRLKALSQIQLDFDKRCKDVEAKFAEKINDMRRQLDHRWKQIDKFETSLKTYADTKAQWKKKLAAKEGELEAIKATNSELSSQLSAMRRPNGPADAMELRAMAARVANAEKRFNNAQNQLLLSEERISQMNQNRVSADGKWEARVKEYEARLKAAEEKVKRERQGSKERVLELENHVKSLQRQLEIAQKRALQLNDVIETNKMSNPGTPGRT